MKFVSFNVNSIRTRLHQLDALVATHSPDFIGLQETKVTDPDFPLDAMQALGYHVEFTGQKTHYGVALLSKHPFQSCVKAFADADDEAQKRFIAGEFLVDGKPLLVVNGYFPQGESCHHEKKFPAKKKFYEDLQSFLAQRSVDEDIIVMGDLNISPEDQDIGIGEPNRKRWLKDGKCSFLPEEREWFQRLLDWGFTDTYRQHYPEDNALFSWFDYRSKGFEREPKRGLRIDFVLATPSMAKRCTSAGIDYDIRAMERPSDHCPVWAEFSDV